MIGLMYWDLFNSLFTALLDQSSSSRYVYASEKCQKVFTQRLLGRNGNVTFHICLDLMGMVCKAPICGFIYGAKAIRDESNV